MKRKYAFCLAPTSTLTVQEAELRLAEHSRTFDRSLEEAVLTSVQLAEDGVYFDTLGSVGETPSAEDSNLVKLDLWEYAASIGVVAHEVWVGE